MAIKGSRKVAIDNFIKAIDDYLQECEDKKQVPFLSVLAQKLDIDAGTLGRYQRHAEYARHIKRVQRATENGLIQKGLNDNKPVFPIFLLKSKFGYIEQQKVDLTSNGETLGVVQLPTRGK